MNRPALATRTTCPYCGVGCGVIASHTGSRLIGVTGDPHHPANRGRLCVKGSTLADTQHGGERLTEPRIGGVPVSWDKALAYVADGFRETLRDHGPGAIACYLSGQLLTEDYYVANKLMKGFLGSANIDTNSRLCMASAVAAHKRAFGEDVVPCDYGDLDHCDLLVLVGSNAAWAHPVLYQRIAARKRAAERQDPARMADGACATPLRIVVIDPRRTATCDIADLHLALRPGSDAALFNALLCHLDRHGARDRRYVDSHTRDADHALAAARNDAADAVVRTGLDAAELARFFDWFTASQRTVTLFSQGVNQASNGTDKANAIINCHLLTGRIGRSGCGPFSITGQPNAMGGREVGGMANQLAAHRDFTAEDCAAVARFWGAPAPAQQPGLKAVEMFEAVARGQIRAIWIMGTNPVVSLPDSDRIRRALLKCPLVVVSDCTAATDTARCAGVLLPARGWGEKDGTVTNSERRISRQRGFLRAPGNAKPDWQILCEVADRLGFGAAFGYRNAREIFTEHARLSGRERDGRRLFDISPLATLDDAGYDALEPVTWPLDGRRPFADGVFPTSDGRARLVPVAPHVPRQRVTAEYPFVLNSGRLRDQWHTMTRTGTAPRLFGHSDAPELRLHPADAEAHAVRTGDLVEVHNAQGRIRALAVTDPGQRRGELFFPMHWNAQFAWPTRVGALIASVTDPVSGQPESKHAAVALRRAETGAWLRLVSAEPPDLAACRGVLRFWSRIPGVGGWFSEVALAPGADPSGWLEGLARQIPHDNRIHYRHGTDQRWLLEHAGRPVLLAFAQPQRDHLPAPDTLLPMLAAANGLPHWQRLAGMSAGTGASARVICTCFEVRESAIEAAIRDGARTPEALGTRLGCGTNCGSCIPELRALIDATTAP